ncbi:MAG TPA: class I SAM-dependent methyltransferase [Candidatus Norongarragalinales archaeon]|jgi:2-polyprenyl-3-methyl-5-hydroxy-6-metoxy-1,4-benzoquinol methylase|nr:class I SAM-dependent methyltransferase [Candidatus Norongarragalinales archaeon]
MQEFKYTGTSAEGKETNALRWASLDRVFHAQRYNAIYDHVLGKSVLEVGCGNGSIIGELKNKKPELDCRGIDINPDYIRNAKTHFPSVNFKVADLYKYKTSADTVVMTEVLEHWFTPIDWLKNLNRLARKRVIVTVPNKNRVENPEHVLFLDHSNFESLLAQVFPRKNITIKPVAADFPTLRNNALLNKGTGRVSSALGMDNFFSSTAASFENSLFLMAIIDKR